MRNICLGWMVVLAVVLVGWVEPVRAADSSLTPASTVAAKADVSVDDFASQLLKTVKPSLVAVKYTFKSEVGSHDLIGPGIVIDESGLVVIPLAIVSPQSIPDGQMLDFKIIVPSETDDETEIDAELVGRDERSSLAFVRVSDTKESKEAGRVWKPVKFTDTLVQVGQSVYSVGIMPKSAGYKAYVMKAMVTAQLRGPVPQVMVEQGLAGPGGVVFNTAGQTVGYIATMALQEAMLNRGGTDDMALINTPPHTFLPTSYVMVSLNDIPTAAKPAVCCWMGTPMLSGLVKEQAEYFGLKNKPAVQVTDVVAGSPADKGGLKTKDIIVEMDGKPLERGDVPEELPSILLHRMQRMKPGTQVTFSVLRVKGDPLEKVTVTLEPQPKQMYAAQRYYASDLGFVAREATFLDLYYRKLKVDSPGVVVALVRREGAAAAAKLQTNDLVLQMNGKAVTNLEQFKADYAEFRKSHRAEPVVLEVSKLDNKQETINIEPPQDSVLPGRGGDQ